jgi:RNA polymerase sigma-70 factor, ECF subfamily
LLLRTCRDIERELETTLGSFEDFYQEQYPRIVRAILLATSDEELSFDATQEAFKRALMRWSRLQKHPWAGGWVMTTAFNVAKRHRSRARRERELLRGVGEAPKVPAPDTRPVDITEALRQLPFRQRQATILYYWGDLPTVAVAELMDIAEGTVRAHLAAARKTLGLKLEDV